MEFVGVYSSKNKQTRISYDSLSLPINRNTETTNQKVNKAISRINELKNSDYSYIDHVLDLSEEYDDKFDEYSIMF